MFLAVLTTEAEVVHRLVAAAIPGRVRALAARVRGREAARTVRVAVLDRDRRQYRGVTALRVFSIAGG